MKETPSSLCLEPYNAVVLGIGQSHWRPAQAELSAIVTTMRLLTTAVRQRLIPENLMESEDRNTESDWIHPGGQATVGAWGEVDIFPFKPNNSND